MSDSSLYDLRNAVLALEPAERDNLRSLLEREEQRAPVRTSEPEEQVWLALTRQAPSRQFRSLSDFLRDKRHGASRPDYQDAVTVVFDIVDQVRPVRHKAQDTAALLELLFECLATDLRDRKVAVTVHNLVADMARLPLAVNDCYPGYLAAGMLHKLIRVAQPA